MDLLANTSIRECPLDGDIIHSKCLPLRESWAEVASRKETTFKNTKIKTASSKGAAVEADVASVEPEERSFSTMIVVPRGVNYDKVVRDSHLMRPRAREKHRLKMVVRAEQYATCHNA